MSSCRLYNCLMNNGKTPADQPYGRLLAAPGAPPPRPCLARTHAQLWRTRAARRGEKMAAPSFPTPLHGHVGRGAFSDVYEPAEDTFLLLDALEAAAAELTGCEEGEGPRGRGFGSPGEAAAQDQGKDCRRPPREEAVSARLGTADTRIL